MVQNPRSVKRRNRQQIKNCENNINLDSIAEQYLSFMYQVAHYLPKLQLHLYVEPLDKHVFRITAIIKNTGFLPTLSELGVMSQWFPKVKAELVPEKDQSLVSGNRFYLLSAIPGGSAVEQSWLVMGKRGSKVNIVVSSPAVGEVSAAIELK